MEKEILLREVLVDKQNDDKLQKILLLQRLIRSYYVRRQFQEVRNEYLKTLNEIEGELLIKPTEPSQIKQQQPQEKVVAIPSKNELLRKRQEIAIELLWLEQAIQSRKDYLRLKPRYLNPVS